MSENRGYQKRYVAYAASQGLTPDEVLARDREKYPGGRMTGFILWIPEQWRRWAAEENETPEWAGGWSDRQHRLFDKWLQATHVLPHELAQGDKVAIREWATKKAGKTS